MARFKLEDGTIIDTTRAAQSWDEERDFDGNNLISRATGSQWTRQTLYKSSKGRYYILHTSQMQGSIDRVELITPADAASWLLMMYKELPADLQEYESSLIE
jgi:hypothetical protein